MQTAADSPLSTQSIFLVRIIKGFLFLMFFGLLISLCFFNNSSWDLDTAQQMMMAAIFFCALIIVSVLLSRLQKVQSIESLSLQLLMAITLLCLLPMQIYLVVSIYAPVGWDVSGVVDHAAAEAPVDPVYLSIFPNNLLLFFIIRLIINLMRFAGITDIWLGLSLVNILIVDLSLVLSVITLKKVNPKFTASPLLIIIFSLLIGLSPWLIAPYSDVFLIPVVSALVLLCVIAAQEENRKKRLIYVMLIGVLFAIGWLIKPIIIAIAAALIVVLMLQLIKNRSKVKVQALFCSYMLPVITFTVSFILVIFMFNTYVRHQNIIAIDETLRTPMTYTIATGLTTRISSSNSNVRSYGAWSPDVAAFNFLRDPQEKNRIYLGMIRQSLQEFGVAGYLEFLVNKARWITSEGNFFWHGESNDMDITTSDSGFLQNLLYTNGIYFRNWLHIVNGLWIVVFFGCCLSMFISFVRSIGIIGRAESVATVERERERERGCLSIQNYSCTCAYSLSLLQFCSLKDVPVI